MNPEIIPVAINLNPFNWGRSRPLKWVESIREN